MKPEEVFTPKGKDINEQIYVQRVDLETYLSDAIRKPKHIVIHGESGCGKTWLYKKVLKDKNIHYEVLNSATINSSGSLIKSIEALNARLCPSAQTGYEERINAEANAVFAKGSVENKKQYSVKANEPYLMLLNQISKKAKRSASFLVIENLEHVVKNENHLRDLSSLILYLDDDEYSQHNVRLILVGTPTDLREYFSKTSESQTIVNRLQEIPEVAALTSTETKYIAKKGLLDMLQISIVDDDKNKFNTSRLLNDVSWYSANIPQYVHEICLEIALESEKHDQKISFFWFVNALRKWVQGSLISENARLEQNVNSRETRHGRRNQVMYTIGFLPANEFNSIEVEERLRALFPKSTQDKTLNISANLIDLSKGEHPIIRKTPKGTHYRFIDPKIKIMTRWILVRDEQEEISVRKFDESIRF